MGHFDLTGSVADLSVSAEEPHRRNSRVRHCLIRSKSCFFFYRPINLTVEANS